MKLTPGDIAHLADAHGIGPAYIAAMVSEGRDKVLVETHAKIHARNVPLDHDHEGEAHAR